MLFYLQARAKRELAYGYQPRYKEMTDDVRWHREYELEEDEEGGEENEEIGGGSEAVSESSDEALADAELKNILTAVLHNDTEFSGMNENVFFMYLRLMEVEADLNRSLAALTQLGSTTLQPLYSSTVQTYVKGNEAHNSEINFLLNRLLQLRISKGLTYLNVLKEGRGNMKYSNDSTVDAEVRLIFAKLMVYAQMYNLSYKNFLASLEALPVPERKKCPFLKAWVSLICFSRFLISARNENCCPASFSNQTRNEL